MASSSKSTFQTSPTQMHLFSLPKGPSMIDKTDYYCFDGGFRTQTSYNDPSLFYPFELGNIACSNNKLIAGCSSICEKERFIGLPNPYGTIGYLSKRPICEFFQRAGSGGEQEITFQSTTAGQIRPIHEFHLIPGCFCQGATRPISALERPSALVDDVVIGMEGGATLVTSRADHFMRMPAIHHDQYNHGSLHIPAWCFSSEVSPMSLADQESSRPQCFNVESFQGHGSMAPALRLFHQGSHGVPSINEITAISCRLCGQSSLPFHASSLSSDNSETRSCQTSLYGDIQHTQLVDRNSARSTEASPLPSNTVLNISPPSNYISSSESLNASFSVESDIEVETQHHGPLSSENVSREEEPLLNRSKLTETFLVISTQVALTLLTIGYGGSSSLSKNAKILLYSSAACNVGGFVCCLLGILICGRSRPGVAARITTGMGYIAPVYGFVAVMGMLLRDNLRLRITGAACIASFPALAFVFMK